MSMKHLLSVSLLGPERSRARSEVVDFVCEGLRMVPYYFANLCPPVDPQYLGQADRILIPWFEELSTRTKYSSEMAAIRLGNFRLLDPIGPENSSLGKHESAMNTARMLAQHGVTHFVLRSKIEGLGLHLAQLLEKTSSPESWVDSSVSVIVGGAGTRDHPTQVLLDAVTIVLRKLGIRKKSAEDMQKLQRHLDSPNLGKTVEDILDNLEIAIVGDLKHSRVAQSWVYLAKWFSIKLILISPEGLEIDPWSLDLVNFATGSSLADAATADFVYMIRLQLERLEESMPAHKAKKMASAFMITPENIDLFSGEIMDAQPLDITLPMIHPSLWNHSKVIMFMQSAVAIPTRMAILRLTDRHRFESVPLLVVPKVRLGQNNIIASSTLDEHWKQMDKKYAGQDLSIGRIRDGCVIDRIDPNMATYIDRVNVRHGLYDRGNQQIRGRCMPSPSLGRKDVIYLHGLWPTYELMAIYALISPRVRLSVMRDKDGEDGGYRRIEPPLPKAVAKVFRCPNKACITNLDPENETFFHVSGKKGDAHLQCAYCLSTFDMSQIIEALVL